MEQDTFEITFRLLNNDMIGLVIKSQSDIDGWAAYGIIALVIVVMLLPKLMPMASLLMSKMKKTPGKEGK